MHDVLGTNNEFVHEHVFGVVDGQVVNRGFFTDGVREDDRPMDGDFSEYFFDGYIYYEDFGTVLGAVESQTTTIGRSPRVVPRWSSTTYRLTRCNCQDCADAVRAQLGY